MTETAFSGSLREAVEEVLEKMFFIETEGQPTEARPAESLLSAFVEFEGSPSGTLSLRITRQAAHRMAADFLGEEAEDLQAARTMEVVAELSNMICGSVLSRVESEAAFHLSSPSTASGVGEVIQPSDGAIVCTVQVPEGALSVTFLCRGAGS